MFTEENPFADKKNRWNNLLLGAAVSFVLLLCFYPDFLFFTATPMHAHGWELSDPSVSWANFKPSFRVFQYELYNHFNILWSSLRTMGMPILANDIQAAPLFPLTLLLSWLDEAVFWNVLVVCRLFLLGLGGFLLARGFLKLDRIPAVLFVISFVYSLYVMRWMNNPWQNGLLSGVWYLYFLWLAANQGPQSHFKRFLVFLGLALSVYMMVTCGFPEAAVMSAFLVVLTFTPFFIAGVRRGSISWRTFLVDLVLAHCVGFALSSYQIFAIVELLASSESHRFVGLRQYSAADLLPFFAENLMRFREAGPQLFDDSRNYFGLVPTLFFLIGIGVSLRSWNHWGYVKTGALLCCLFMLFKVFAIGPEWFNVLVATPPVLRESYFYVYFFSIFIWFFAYFAALGLQSFLRAGSGYIQTSLVGWKIFLFFILLVFAGIVWKATLLVTETTMYELIVVEREKFAAYAVGIAGAASILMFIYLFFREKKSVAVVVPLLLIGGVVAEQSLTLPKDFNHWEDTSNRQLEGVLNRLSELGAAKVESRIVDRNGEYVSHGLATIDTGATPLLPKRTQVFRTNFFRTVRAGHLSIEGPKSKFSWDITSTNIKAFDRYYGEKKHTLAPWHDFERRPAEQFHFDEIAVNGTPLQGREIHTVSLSPEDYFYVKGWGIGAKEHDPQLGDVYLVLERTGRQLIIPLRKAVRQDVATHFRDDVYTMSGWDGYFSADILTSGKYSAKLLLAFQDQQVVYEHDPAIQLVIEKKHPTGVEQTPAARVDEGGLLFLGVLDHYYMYLDPAALPRAYVASRCFPKESMMDVVDTFKTTRSFALGQVYIENVDAAEKALCQNYSRATARVVITSDTGKSIELETVQGPAVVVLNDNIYPGWHAMDILTGQQLEIKPGNICFRSVVLPKERQYQVRMYYKPWWISYAKSLIALALLIVTVYCAFPLMRKRI